MLFETLKIQRAMKNKKSGTVPSGTAQFKNIFDKIAYRESYEKVFDDFLKLIICCYTRNYITGLSYYEEEYFQIIEPYKEHKTQDYFPQLLAELILYMENMKNSSEGNDLLGTFYETELSHGRNGQFFTPFHLCAMMAKMLKGEDTKSCNVLDPSCGSGRMLLAFAKDSTLVHTYYGIDIDPLCVKMTAINMFLNGLQGEVICADALAPADFKFGYKISLFPLGIFKIEKEQSLIWQHQQNGFSEIKKDKQGPSDQTQLQLF
ncbi:MAG: hypothetical protein POELPBGB_01320 [Bacteroidia bacterium]|nr:hypothetical protein [Bacteroidia bacterium]